jgi:acyl-CoA thioester hydrolase
MAMIECYRGVVHPWLCDVMGHLTTRYYAAMFDDGSYHLLAAIGHAQHHIRNGVGFADVKATFNYRAELRAGDLLVIHGKIVRVGEKSLTAHYAMKNLRTEVTAAEMETVTVQFDLNARQAIPLVPEIRKGAEALLAKPGGEGEAKWMTIGLGALVRLSAIAAQGRLRHASTDRGRRFLASRRPHFS